MRRAASGGAGTFQQRLSQAGWPHQIVELPQTTRRASEAAAAVGCTVDQIAKSLIFCGQTSQRAILVIASGRHRVDEARLAELTGEPIGKADADFVRAQTGYAIGGVPPIGHAKLLPTFIDRTLLDYALIWAAAGSPFAVFQLTPAELVTMTGGHIVDIAAD